MKTLSDKGLKLKNTEIASTLKLAAQGGDASIYDQAMGALGEVL
jgi:hypothetical protein